MATLLVFVVKKHSRKIQGINVYYYDINFKYKLPVAIYKKSSHPSFQNHSSLKSLFKKMLFKQFKALKDPIYRSN